MERAPAAHAGAMWRARHPGFPDFALVNPDYDLCGPRSPDGARASAGACRHHVARATSGAPGFRFAQSALRSVPLDHLQLR